MKSIAYTYGEKLAAPWSTLRAGLQHGAVSAVPGAVLGGVAGAVHGVQRPDGTKDRMGGALRGAAMGGTATGLIGGGASALMQSGMNRMVKDPTLIAKNLAEANIHAPAGLTDAVQKHVGAYTQGTWLNPFKNIVRDPATGF